MSTISHWSFGPLVYQRIGAVSCWHLGRLRYDRVGTVWRLTFAGFGIGGIGRRVCFV